MPGRVEGKIALVTGGAIGFGVIGWLSDHLAPAHVPAALGLALLLVCAGAGAVALGLFGWTARQMRAA